MADAGEMISSGLQSFAASQLIEDAAQFGWNAQKLAIEAGKRGLINNSDIATYYNLLESREGKGRRAQLLESMATERVPVEQSPEEIPAGFISQDRSLPQGVNNMRNPQSQLSREQTEDELFNKYGIGRSQLMAESKAEAIDPEMAKIVRDNFRTTQTALNQSMQLINQTIGATGQTVKVRGAGGKPILTPRGVMSGEAEFEFGGQTQPRYEYKPPSGSSGEDITLKNQQLLFKTQQEEANITKDMADWSKNSQTMKDNIITLRGMWELQKSLYQSLGAQPDFIQAQGMQKYLNAKQKNPSIADMLYPEFAPAAGSVVAPLPGARGPGADFSKFTPK
jgi:hypothetical protein